ncbi:unnamed protein product [Meganyctiphanes norvegica]|uniref:ODAD1 central coiled coil region domain-containing protein n=1 Tax=Meganyctiphanes norvegica TaxID=48144 RepID=A0AAV2STS5_MEGNR
MSKDDIILAASGDIGGPMIFSWPKGPDKLLLLAHSASQRFSIENGGENGEGGGGGGGGGGGEDVELESAENLLGRLKKQYHMMERNRRQYSDETHALLTKQRKIFGDLQKEKSTLESTVKACTTVHNEQKDQNTINTLSSTLDRQEKYEELIEQEKDKITDLDTTITALERKLRESRKRIPSARQLEARRQAAIQANKALQNRIQQATVRLNAVLSDNRVLRSTLENLLKERDKFILQAQRLEKLLQTTVRRKNDVMDQVTKAYAERDEAQTKMKSMRERSVRDTQLYTHELKKLQRALDHQHHLRAFVATISAGEDDDTARNKKEGDSVERGGPEQSLAGYRMALMHLREMGGEDAEETIVSNYLQAENDNYTLFSYISDLNNEVTGLLAEVRQLRVDIDSTKGQGEKEEKDTQRTMTTMQNDVEETKEAVITLRNELQMAENTLTDMKTSTQELFDLLQCDPTPVIAIVV